MRVSSLATPPGQPPWSNPQEILFPPMSYLEVTGETRMEAGPNGKLVRVVSLSVNANQTCGTIEEMLGARMRLHVAMLENYELEIRGELEARLDSEVDARALDARPRSRLMRAGSVPRPQPPWLLSWSGFNVDYKPLLENARKR